MEIGRNIPSQSFRASIKNEVPRQVELSHPKNFESKVSEIELNKKVESINKFLTSTNSSLKFTLHEELNEYYVSIIDEQTKEIIKEIPPKKLLDMFAAMKETIGLFIDKKI
ncbi:flagellar protein FlaG [Anaerobacillus alkaliphilus]|uniref:Flagellar protein FlaG n=1 Tax=Anaerobacillus alkaliphilus TaxID=1548597 RepID=A0A4Q0VV05_9BACI|nr:flagellar protein FlaG [Anaerobacillus alkaliphilus]RXJ02273.1 flagellar protein FlaG [Anaerobacillus alkaliphilus]